MRCELYDESRREVPIEFLNPHSGKLLPQFLRESLLGKLTSDRGKRLATDHTGCSRGVLRDMKLAS
jgi:hypothetical protein